MYYIEIITLVNVAKEKVESSKNVLAEASKAYGETQVKVNELQAQLEQDFSQAEESGESTEQLNFALENIEEYDDNPAENTEELLPEEETDRELEIPVVDEGEEI